MKIGIDPGHGYPDEYNRGPTGYVEAHGNLHMGICCAAELKRLGYEVLMTRNKKYGLSLRHRAEILNTANVDLAVSIHSNAASNPQARGIETIYSVHHNKPFDGNELAQVIANKLHNDLGLPIRRVFDRDNEETPEKDDYYGIIRMTSMPCVIVEVAFHSNPIEEAKLKDPAFREKAGISIARGIHEAVLKYGSQETD